VIDRRSGEQKVLNSSEKTLVLELKGEGNRLAILPRHRRVNVSHDGIDRDLIL